MSTWALPTFAARSRLDLLDVFVALDDRPPARQLLAELDEIRRWRRGLGVLDDEIDRARHRIAALPPGGQGTPALTPAESRVLDYLQTHLTFVEIGERLFISRSTVNTHAGAIYRKLGASSRGEAVEQARRLGLLAGGD